MSTDVKRKIVAGIEAYLTTEGWTIDRSRFPFEAVMPSGYGSGPAVIVPDKMAEEIMREIVDD